jgi:hypothetical protein
MDKMTEMHVQEWTENRELNKNLFEETDNNIYKYRYQACERLLLTVK